MLTCITKNQGPTLFSFGFFNLDKPSGSAIAVDFPGAFLSPGLQFCRELRCGYYSVLMDRKQAQQGSDFFMVRDLLMIGLGLSPSLLTSCAGFPVWALSPLKVSGAATAVTLRGQVMFLFWDIWE